MTSQVCTSLALTCERHHEYSLAMVVNASSLLHSKSFRISQKIKWTPGVHLSLTHSLMTLILELFPEISSSVSGFKALYSFSNDSE